MRPIKRLLVFASELGVLAFGFVGSVALGSVFNDYFYSRGDFGLGDEVASVVFLFGLLLTTVGFAVLLRKHRSWKLEYDAVGWALTQAERRLYPTRARLKRIILRTVLWAPSAVAAFVLFFFPVATHVVHPGRLLRDYYVPIPWTFTILQWLSPTDSYSSVNVIVSSSGKGRFGITPFPIGPLRQDPPLLSHFDFESNSNARPFDFETAAANSDDATQVVTRQFRLDDAALTCWQYRPRRPRHALYWPASGFSWYVLCAGPASGGRQNFQAIFRGREEDLQSFYQIIEGVRPIIRRPK
jgi:hypothetical protein